MVQMIVMLIVVFFYDWEGLSDSAVRILAGPVGQTPEASNPLTSPLLGTQGTHSARASEEEQRRRSRSRDEVRQAVCFPANVLNQML